uniref:poly(A)-specific ribonuclease n=1 Tax=Salarias fasciatus TaxID=181472 RepID=A0A672GET7_SALFA
MPKEKYDPPDPRRCYTIMSTEEAASGKKSHWAELEMSGRVRSLSSSLWTLTHLTALHINDNNLSRLPPDIAKLPHLVYLNLSSNKLRSLPAELGNMVSLRELLLNNNLLRVLPYELGRLFQLQTLGLKGNPLSQDILNLYQEPDGTRKLLNYMLDNLAVHPEQLPQRPWITLKERDQVTPTAAFTVMCYNVLCDKYATRQLYGYCPSWALSWEYRKKGIMEEITHCDADIISLQEVETEQYYALFLETLKGRGYDGYFCPKSRAKLVSEQERRHVDGCAVFFKTQKFTLVQKHTVEFNQVAMANSEGSEVMLNRVMTKDNIGVAVLLEVNKDLFSGGVKTPPERQLVLVANAHMHWDPEYSDVKLIQTMMFLSELKSIAERASGSAAAGSPASDVSSIPIVLCADLNSLPDSGVVEYLSNGGVAENHKDFKELRYNECLTNFSCNGKNGASDGSITHSFQLRSAYDSSLMPYTNYTYDFKVPETRTWSAVLVLGEPEGLTLCVSAGGHRLHLLLQDPHERAGAAGTSGPPVAPGQQHHGLPPPPHPVGPLLPAGPAGAPPTAAPAPPAQPPQRPAPAGAQVVQPDGSGTLYSPRPLRPPQTPSDPRPGGNPPLPCPPAAPLGFAHRAILFFSSLSKASNQKWAWGCR